MKSTRRYALPPAAAFCLAAILLSPAAAAPPPFANGRFIYSNLCIGAGGLVTGHRVTLEHHSGTDEAQIEFYGSSAIETDWAMRVGFDPATGHLQFRYYATDDDDYFGGTAADDALRGSFTDSGTTETLPRVTQKRAPQACRAAGTP